MADLDKMIIKMLPIGEAGFPGVMCPVIFIGGCNFKCPYCLNADIVNDPIKKEYVPIADVAKYVDENWEEHILISGGEPCLNPRLEDLIDYLTNGLGLKVRLSTNGSKFNILTDLLVEHKVSFVAMDIKTDMLNANKWSEFMDPNERGNVISSIGLLNSTLDTPELSKDFSFEFRTTLYPELVGDKEIEEISKQIHPNSRWYLQQFRPREGLLSPSASSVKPYSQSDIDRLLNLAKKNVKNTLVRWP